MTTLPNVSICPFCRGNLSFASGNSNCPHCDNQVYNVACSKCGRRTINLSLLVRYGKTSCFVCHYEVNQLMESEQAEVAPVETLLSKPALASTAASVTIPPAPVLPSYSEARDAVEANMRGLERAMLDRELLRAPELRVIANRYIDTIQDLLALDSAMEQGEVNQTSLRTAENLDIISRLCFRPLWQDDGSQLPAAAYGWLLAVDDAARRWQYARRKWLLTECQLKLLSIIPQITPVNSSRHIISGEGRLVSALLAPGFMLGEEILRKAEIIAE